MTYPQSSGAAASMVISILESSLPVWSFTIEKSHTPGIVDFGTDQTYDPVFLIFSAVYVSKVRKVNLNARTGNCSVSSIWDGNHHDDRDRGICTWRPVESMILSHDWGRIWTSERIHVAWFPNIEIFRFGGSLGDIVDECEVPSPITS